MAKKSVVLRNEKRKKLVKVFAEKRAELKRRAMDQSLTEDERFEARIKLQKMPRDTSKVRVRNRCQISGRGRGVYRRYMISRIVFREFAHKGYIPGVNKASW